MTRGVKRDVTRALEMIDEIIGQVMDQSRATTDRLFKLVPLLERIDARETRLKPSLRKGYRAKKSDPKRSPAKKSVAKAKKATRRVKR